jgi:hypothetical protein
MEKNVAMTFGRILRPASTCARWAIAFSSCFPPILKKQHKSFPSIPVNLDPAIGCRIKQLQEVSRSARVFARSTGAKVIERGQLKSPMSDRLQNDRANDRAVQKRNTRRNEEGLQRNALLFKIKYFSHLLTCGVVISVRRNRC